jgi:hypothetical protein
MAEIRLLKTLKTGPLLDSPNECESQCWCSTRLESGLDSKLSSPADKVSAQPINFATGSRPAEMQLLHLEIDKSDEELLTRPTVDSFKKCSRDCFMGPQVHYNTLLDESI